MAGAACALLAAVCAPAFPARAENDDRMAGSVYVAPRSHKADASAPASLPVEDQEQRDTTSSDVDFTALEALGLFTQPGQGSLGRDMWRGSSRTDITADLPRIPSASPYRTIERLTARLLLTAADPSLIRQNGRPQPGEDMTTLRLEKLLETGAFREAWALYSAMPGDPYHERYARMGVLAALYSREPALACLEAKTFQARFSSVEFWRQLSAACNRITASSAGRSVKESAETGSQILDAFILRDTFRFKAATLSDLRHLLPLEAAVLAAENRFDFSNLAIGEHEEIPPHVLALLIDDPSLPEEASFRLLLRAVERGVRPISFLTSYYETKATLLFGKNKQNTSLSEFVAVEGWKRLPYIYRAATNAPGAPERQTIVRKALELATPYGDAALWPLATIIAGIDADSLAPEQVRAGLRILAQTATPAGPGWADAFRLAAKDGGAQGTDLLLLEIDHLSTEDSVKDGSQQSDLAKSLEGLNSQEKALVASAYEKLDKRIKLHNYGAGLVYDNTTTLTSSEDYVMPSDGLLNRLAKAKAEQRPGEIVLLSSIALDGTTPDRLSPELFQAVIDGLLSVGLTKETQLLANEVILALKK